MPINTIIGLFAKSPIKPLQHHAKSVSECCEQLLSFFDACHRKGWDEAGELYQEISRIEKEADVLKREIRLNFPRGIFMPFERTDLLDLLTQQDKLANLAKDIAGRTYGRKLEIPTIMYDDFIRYARCCLDAAAQSKKVIAELDELLETGFKGPEVDLVETMINELDELEDTTDTMQIHLRQQLRIIEHEYSPVDVMFLYKIIEWVGGIADQAQRVGARIELMLARS